MSTRYFPSGYVEIGGMPAYFGYPYQPPYATLVTAEHINKASGHSIEQGRYHPDRGEIRGIAEFKRQDAYITGTAGRTGTAFDVVSGGGVWKDNLKETVYNTYGLYLPDSAPGTVYEVVSNASFTNGIPDCEMLLARGGPGVSASDANYKAGECYTYLTFGYPNQYQYQLIFEYGRPIGLRFSTDSGSTWLKPAIARNLGSLQSVLKANSDAIPLRLYMDRVRESLVVEIGNGGRISYGLPKAYKGEMVRPGKLRVQTKNGWMALHLWPARNTKIQATIAQRDYGKPLSNLQKARLLTNASGNTPDGQTTSFALTGDGQKVGFTVQATLPDAGDGLGSVEAPILSDMTLVIEGVWVQDVDGLPDFRTASFPWKRVVETEEFNPLTRIYRQHAQVICSNAYGQLNDLVGDVAVNLYASNYGPTYQRMQGIARNPRLQRADPVRLYTMDVGDKMTLLEKQIQQEIKADNWCVYSLVRMVADICGIHPRYMQRIPLYIPPGATEDAPYGRAGYDCPYPILGSGTGANSKYHYLPNVTGIAILLELVQDMVEKDPISGRAIPFYTGVDSEGQLVFEPMNLFERLPKWSFRDIDGSGQGQIFGMVDWRYNTDNLRTDIILQGEDAITGDLLHVQRQMGANVRRMRGTRVPLFDRSPRYVDIEQMEEAIDAMEIPASIPELTGAQRVPFWPHLHAGDLVWDLDQMHGISGLFVIEKAQHVYGMQDVTGQTGYVDCYSDILLRALINYF